MSISSDDNTDSTELDCKYDSEHDPDVDMRMEDTVDTLEGVDLDGDLDMERDCDDEEEENEEEDEEEEDKDEEEKEEKEEDEDEDEDEDDGKEPRTISRGAMVNTSADDVDTMVDNQAIVLPEQSQEMCEHTPQPQPLAPSPRLQTPEPHPRPPTLETHPLSGLEDLGIVTPQKPRPTVRSLREAEAAGNTSDVDVD